MRRFNITKLNNTKFPANIGLRNNKSGVRALVVGTTRYRPCVATSSHLVRSYTTRIMRNVHVLTRVLRPHRVLVNVRSGGPRTVSVLHTILTSSGSVSLQIVPAGCPSNNTGRLACVLAKGRIPRNKHSSSVNMLVRGINATCTIGHTIVSNRPVARHIMALANRTVTHPNGI